MIIDYGDENPLKPYESPDVLIQNLIANTKEAGQIRRDAIFFFSWQVQVHWEEMWEKEKSKEKILRVYLIHRLIRNFFYYFNLSIETADWADVQERFVQLLPDLLKHPLPKKWFELNREDLPLEVEKYVEEAPEFQDFLKFASERFKELLKIPKYAERMPRDPIGL